MYFPEQTMTPKPFESGFGGVYVTAVLCEKQMIIFYFDLCYFGNIYILNSLVPQMRWTFELVIFKLI